MPTPYSRKGTTDLSKKKESKAAKGLGSKRQPVKQPRKSGRKR